MGMAVADMAQQELDGILPGGLTWTWVQGEGITVYREDDPILSVVWSYGKVKMEHYEGGVITLEQKFLLGKIAAQLMDREQPIVEEIWRIVEPYARMTLADKAKVCRREELANFFDDGNPVYYKTLTGCIDRVREQLGMCGEEWDEAFELYSNVYTYADEVENCIIETLRPYFAFEFVLKEPDEDD